MKKNQKSNTEQQNQKKRLTRRSILLLATGALLLVLLVLGAAAWYTRLSTVNKLTMDAANFDFKANFTDEDFKVYASDYINVNDKHAAPGTIGVIPINVSAQDSDVDVSYTIKIETKDMDDQFRRRIRYFYFVDDGNGGIQEKTFDGNNRISGTIAKGMTAKPQYEFIYWEWVYELSPEVYYNATESQWKYNEAAESFPFTEEDREAFDEFDTKVGEGKFDSELVTTKDGEPVTYASMSQVRGDGSVYQLLAYQGAMEAEIKISGAQAMPVHEEELAAADYVSGSGCGSVKVEVPTVIERHNQGIRN